MNNTEKKKKILYHQCLLKYLTTTLYFPKIQYIFIFESMNLKFLSSLLTSLLKEVYSCLGLLELFWYLIGMIPVRNV